jgi:hypothetical protein
MRHLELMTCVVAGLFTRPEHYAALNRRLEHALDDDGDLKRRPGRTAQSQKSKARSN